MRNSLFVRVVIALVMFGLQGRARAQQPAPAVDAADLPPLPAAEEETSSSATVIAAASAEEDVVVGAAKREQSLGNVASAVTVVSGDRIRRFGYRTIGEALASVAGTYLVDNRESYTLGIRGLNIPGDFNTRILVLVDGATMNDPWGSFAGIGFDNFVSIDDISRIELIRGPVSSVYGANAFFGIINIVTRSASETPGLWGRISVNSINGVIGAAGFAAGTVQKGIRGTFQSMGRFGEKLTVPNITGNNTDGSLSGGDGSYQIMGSLVGTVGGTFAQARFYRYERGDPFAPFLGDPTQVNPYIQDDTQVLLEAGHTKELTDKITVTARAYANLYQFTDNILQSGIAPFEDRGDGFEYGAEVRGRFEIFPKKLGLTTGAEATYYDTYSRSQQDSTAPDPPPTCTNPDFPAACTPKNFNIEGVYAELDGQPLPFLGFTAGLRFDNNSAIEARFSPRAALFLSRSDTSGLKFLFAQGFRNPSAYEAFFYDNVSYLPAQNLKAEVITSYEAVAWAKPISGLSLRLSGFYWDVTNGIEALSPPTPDLMDPEILQFQNAAHYVSEGVEAEGSYRNSQGWYAFGGVTYSRVGCANCGAITDGAVDSNGNPVVVFGSVPNAPAWVASAGVSTPKLFGKFHLSTELQYLGVRPTRPSLDDSYVDGMVAQMEYTSPNAAAWLNWNWTLYWPQIAKHFDFTAGVRNLIGTRQQVVTPGENDIAATDSMGNGITTVIPVVPGEGREFYVKLGYNY